MEVVLLFVIAGLALMIGFKNSRIQYLKDERNHYKKVSDKLEEDINQLTKNK